MKQDNELPPWRQTWHVIRETAGDVEYCGGIVMSDEEGKPSCCDDVVITDSGCYPPKLDGTAQLVAAAPELVRALLLSERPASARVDAAPRRKTAPCAATSGRVCGETWVRLRLLGTAPGARSTRR
jgi:hypothetical protein